MFVFGGIDVTGKESSTEHIWEVDVLHEQPEWKSHLI